jgi:hypothetical protein
MTAIERKHADSRDESFGEVVEAVNMGDRDAAFEATRELFHAAAGLRRAHISAHRRNRSARERNQAMRDLGMVRTPFGWE